MRPKGVNNLYFGALYEFLYVCTYHAEVVRLYLKAVENNYINQHQRADVRCEHSEQLCVGR